MITRTYDPTWFNMVSNHPKVHPWVSEDGKPVDVSKFLRSGSVGLCSDHGGFILVPKRLGVVDPHGFFLPQDNRAERALADTIEATRYSFLNFNIDRMESSVPLSSSLRGTGRLLEAAGFKLDGGSKTHDHYWLSKRRFFSLHR